MIMQNTKSKKSTNGQHKSGASNDRSKTKGSNGSNAFKGERSHPQLEKFFEITYRLEIMSQSILPGRL